MILIKIAGTIVAGTFLLLLAGFLIFVVVEAVRPDETFASSSGLSVRECIDTAVRLGMRGPEADDMCTKRVPKKR